MWTSIQQSISEATQKPFVIRDKKPISGGDINQAFVLTDGQQSYFIKLNDADKLSMFEAEFEALNLMHDSQSIKVPQAIVTNVVDHFSYIVMGYLELSNSVSIDSWKTMGVHLAQMHKYKGASRFGWDRNNTIGTMPQINDWAESWADFFTDQRIAIQIEWAEHKGASFSNTKAVLNAIRFSLSNHHPSVSLVHGDLWSGNAAALSSGEPVIYDPALYWGDREVDIAMTGLFGGFSTAFYDAYEKEWPLSLGFKKRQIIYNLYHILNHYNLFGGAYADKAQRMMTQILAVSN